ncbi:MAG: exodeoxyribonuclease VII large subunit [Lachnospiraceae bacterium]
MAEAYTVSKVNSYIKNMFQADFVLNRLSVKGEVSNCKYHTSGHVYFTLKDEGGTLNCVMWRSSAVKLDFKLEQGMQVIVTGKVDVYESSGAYQLYATAIQKDGTGDLFLKYQKLKFELEEMGVFSDIYKKRIPEFAMKIGVATASTGAAVRDIMNISSRRNPYVQLYLYPTLVQGEGAASSIVKAVEELDKMNLDVLIVGRGGGSIEDLWAFNEREVAMAVFNCNTPVISAVGHETDYTIIDFVADLRAPTPSAAAELAVFDYNGFVQCLEGFKDRLDIAIDNVIKDYGNRLENLRLRLARVSPDRLIDERRMKLTGYEQRMENAINAVLKDNKSRLSVMAARLDGVSPLKKLTQGYSYAVDDNGVNIKTVCDVKKDSNITLYVSDGVIDGKVVSTRAIKRQEG